MSLIVRLPKDVSWEVMNNFLRPIDLKMLQTSHVRFNLFIVGNDHFTYEGEMTVSKSPAYQLFWFESQQIKILNLKFDSILRNNPVDSNQKNFHAIRLFPHHLFKNVVKTLHFKFDSTIVCGQGPLISEIVNSVLHCTELKLDMHMELAQQVLDTILPNAMTRLNSLSLRVRHCRNGMTVKLPEHLIESVTNLKVLEISIVNNQLFDD